MIAILFQKPLHVSTICIIRAEDTSNGSLFYFFLINPYILCQGFVVFHQHSALQVLHQVVLVLYVISKILPLFEVGLQVCSKSHGHDLQFLELLLEAQSSNLGHSCEYLVRVGCVGDDEVHTDLHQLRRSKLLSHLGNLEDVVLVQLRPRTGAKASFKSSMR